MEISFRPEWENIERTRNAVAAFCSSRNLPSSFLDATVMIVSELAENAIKYGYFSSQGSDVRAVVTLGDGHLTIEVINPVGPETISHLEELDRTIQWIRSFQDPFEAYTERLREVSKKNPDDQTSGLGLARIAFEAQAILDFFVDEEDMLNVSAIFNRTEGV